MPPPGRAKVAQTPGRVRVNPGIEHFGVPEFLGMIRNVLERVWGPI